MRWILRMAVVLTLLAMPGLPAAQTGLELIDGRVLEGVAVERVEDGYQLVLETGARIVVPAELVRQVRLITEPPTPSIPDEALSEPPDRTPEPVIETPPEQLPPQPRSGPSYEQLAVFGEQRPIVARDTVDPRWRPDSDWDQELVANEFDPSTWRNPTLGSRWVPQESLDRAADWATSQAASWPRPAVRSAWWPRDGFAD